MRFHFDFMGARKFFYIFSAVVIIASLVSFALFGFNYGLDFSGGNLFQIKFDNKAVDSQQVRNVLGQFSLENSSIQTGGDGSFTIKMVDIDQSKQEQILKSFTDKLGKYDLLRSEKVGPVIGSELRRAALLALALASVLQIIYITFRFDFKMGLAAVLALMHDVIVQVGFFAIFRFEVDSAFIAAVLTVVGYSINDTIVIFDRIRENVRNRKRGEDLAVTIDNSINQTLTRSINTVLTVIFVLVALLVLGGETTKTLSLALLVGVTCGCYSSICVASPLWYDMKPEEHKRQLKASKAKV